jgi:hypothetical protein
MGMCSNPHLPIHIIKASFLRKKKKQNKNNFSPHIQNRKRKKEMGVIFHGNYMPKKQSANLVA